MAAPGDRGKVPQKRKPPAVTVKSDRRGMDEKVR